MTDLPNQLRRLRLARGLSQQQLADAVGCSKMQISTLERGVQSLDLSWMRRLAVPLRVDPGALLNPEDNPDVATTAEERSLLNIARAMPPDLRARFLAVGEALTEQPSVDGRAAQNG